MPRLRAKHTNLIMRLALHGCNNRPFYHIVLTRTINPRDDPPLETLGSYDPMVNIYGEKLVSMDTARIMHHLGKGVSMSKPVEKLFGLSGLLPVHPMSYITALRNRNKMENSQTEVQTEAGTESEPQS